MRASVLQILANASSYAKHASALDSVSLFDSIANSHIAPVYDSKMCEAHMCADHSLSLSVRIFFGAQKRMWQ